MKIPTFATLAMILAVFPGTLAAAGAKDVGFSATISEIRITRQFDSKTIVSGVDPRFLVKLTLHEDVEDIGKSGDSVSFAIHSLARDLNITDRKTAMGSRMVWEVIRKDGSDMLRLRRVATGKPQ